MLDYFLYIFCLCQFQVLTTRSLICLFKLWVIPLLSHCCRGGLLRDLIVSAQFLVQKHEVDVRQVMEPFVKFGNLGLVICLINGWGINNLLTILSDLNEALTQYLSIICCRQELNQICNHPITLKIRGKGVLWLLDGRRVISLSLGELQLHFSLELVEIVDDIYQLAGERVLLLHLLLLKDIHISLVRNLLLYRHLHRHKLTDIAIIGHLTLHGRWGARSVGSEEVKNWKVVINKMINEDIEKKSLLRVF